jgi:hypothetical protein
MGLADSDSDLVEEEIGHAQLSVEGIGVVPAGLDCGSYRFQGPDYFAET